MGINRNNMTYDKKFIAQTRTSVQISPDDWDTISPAIEVTRETTIGEIVDWMTAKYRYASEIRIIPLDKPELPSPPYSKGN
jgi:hypothetical protein